MAGIDSARKIEGSDVQLSASRALRLNEHPFHEVLEMELPDTAGLSKGERTRRRFVAAAARVLDRDGFHGTRVTDICEIAGVSQGTFYLYFNNKNEITLAVLEEFNERGLALLRVIGPRARAWDAIYESILALTRLYRLNPGLMRCLWQINDEVPEFGEILRRSNAIWHRAVARSITRRCELTDDAAQLSMLVAYALAAMVDQFLVQLYVIKDPQVEAVCENEEQVAEHLSVLWYRAAYCENPPDDVLSSGQALAHLSLKAP